MLIKKVKKNKLKKSNFFEFKILNTVYAKSNTFIKKEEIPKRREK